ncbi:MAG: sigma-70 family RNA polymerase sigma factor [Verrucomicrobia bacterium]|nr:sigma-70 family RNA polymerase sigma factor [Verrucomicrobiota bacterium]
MSDCAPPAAEKPPEPLDVAALTRRMARGEELAYRTFSDAYFNRLSRYLLVVTAGDEDAAREALQAALVRVVRHIKVFPSDAVFWSWLTVLARSALSDQSRKRRRYLAFLDRFTWHTRAQQAAPVDPEADARLGTLLETSLGMLPFDERRLLEAKYFERRSVRQLAEELSLSEKAVDSRLVRIRQKLKNAILEALKRE